MPCTGSCPEPLVPPCTLQRPKSAAVALMNYLGNFTKWETGVPIQTRKGRRPEPRSRVNPFRHTIETDSARLAPSAPSTANARLQVTGSSCHLAGSLPASRQCSDRPGFDGLDFAGHGFLMTDDVAEELLVSAEVIAGFRFTRV